MTSPAALRRTGALRTLLGSPGTRSALDELTTPLPDDVLSWLGQLALLEGVPFNALVPDARMLPPESIRFFHLDDNWMDALRDGALSVVDLSEQDDRMLGVTRPRLAGAVHDAAAAVRPRRRARARRTAVVALPPSGDPEPPPKPWTGLLLRSAIVSDWPGVAVAAYADEAGREPLRLLRLDRPAPTVLLAIFGGIVQQVTIAKPAQGLHFGVVEEAEDVDGDGAAEVASRLRAPGEERGYQVYLRGLGGEIPAGAQIPDRPPVEVPFRAGPGRRKVLDIAALRDALTDAVRAAYDPGQPPQPLPLEPGGFGLQLVAGAELQAFVPHPTLDVPTSPAPAPTRAPVDRVTIADLMEALRHGR